MEPDNKIAFSDNSLCNLYHTGQFLRVFLRPMNGCVVFGEKE